MATALRKDRKTPGVYVTEFESFPPSVVGVATAVPIFVGYTETAVDPSSGKQMYMQAVPISSMADYYNYFGHGFQATGIVEVVPTAESTDEDTDGSKVVIDYDFEAPTWDGTNPPTNKNFVVGNMSSGDAGVTFASQFNLYAAMQLFYSNGGGNCFVISVSNYWGDPSTKPTPEKPATQVKPGTLSSGLKVAADVRGGTMLVVPDACLCYDAGAPDPYSGYGAVVNEMLQQSATLQDRVAILDLPGALQPENWTYQTMQAKAQIFYAETAPSQPYFSYGAAYGPAVETSLLSASDVTYNNLRGTPNSTTWMNSLLTTQAHSLYPDVVDPDDPSKKIYSPSFQDIAHNIAKAFPITDPTTSFGTPEGVTGMLGTGAAALIVSLPLSTADELEADSDVAPIDPAVKTLDQYLLNATPLLGKIQQILVNKLNVLPPSGIMAGVWTQNDANRGVWNAPANIALNQVVKPMVVLTDEQQGEFNVPLNGEAIDILRAMINRGTVVWGARTLDGNSLDYRYIQVRRTLVYIEQSIKLALQQFVFAPNDGGTWATVTATISNFLTQLWQAGGLMGDKASDAFTVKCGVPTTMSGLDVLNGYMIVNVTVQMIHPAEFIELTFKQTMQGV
jgi:phage tail sheath protein FI